jgi:hypothetical protein
MPRKGSVACATEKPPPMSAAEASANPQQIERPPCPVCSAKMGKPVYLELAIKRSQSDLYKCEHSSCRFMREIPAQFEKPADVICPTQHPDEKPRVCVEDERFRGVYKNTKVMRCPDRDCSFSVRIPLKRI